MNFLPLYSFFKLHRSLILPVTVLDTTDTAFCVVKMESRREYFSVIAVSTALKEVEVTLFTSLNYIILFHIIHQLSLSIVMKTEIVNILKSFAACSMFHSL